MSIKIYIILEGDALVDFGDWIDSETPDNLLPNTVYKGVYFLYNKKYLKYYIDMDKYKYDNTFLNKFLKQALINNKINKLLNENML